MSLQLKTLIILFLNDDISSASDDLKRTVRLNLEILYTDDVKFIYGTIIKSTNGKSCFF